MLGVLATRDDMNAAGNVPGEDDLCGRRLVLLGKLDDSREQRLREKVDSDD